MYSELQKNILYIPSVLYGENVFAVDSVLAKVDSFDGVKSADVYILIKWQYYDDWIIRQIVQRLILPQRPLLDKSKSSAFKVDISEIL